MKKIEKNGCTMWAEYPTYSYRIYVRDINVNKTTKELELSMIRPEELDLKSSYYGQSTVYDLQTVYKTFPKVTKLIIGENIETINVPNHLFPNVKEIVSKNQRFESGSCLIENRSRGYGRNKTDYQVLLNAFCKHETDEIDLTEVDEIEAYALEGCKAKIVAGVFETRTNEKTVRGYIGALKQPETVSTVGSYIVACNSKLETLDLSSGTYNQLLCKNNINIKNLIIDSWNSLGVMLEESKLKAENLIANTDEKVSFSALTRKKNWCFKSIKIQSSNPYYKTIDGVLFNKDGRELLKYPLKREGHYNVPEGVKKISPCAFEEASLTSVKLADSLSFISERAFNGSELEAIDFGCGISQINGSQCFANLKNLKTLSFPENIEVLHSFTFQNCSNLESLDLGNVNVIQDNVFSCCNSLKEVTLPKSLLAIGNNSFNNAEHFVIKGEIPDYFFISIVETNDYYAEPSHLIKITLEKTDKTFYVTKVIEPEKYRIWFAEDYKLCDIDQDCIDRFMELYPKKQASCQQDMSLKLYFLDGGNYLSEKKNKELYSYLRRVSGGLARRLIEEGRKEDFVRLVNSDIMTDNAVNNVMDFIRDNGLNEYASYALRRATKTKKRTFRL